MGKIANLRKRRISNVLYAASSLFSAIPQLAPIGIALNQASVLLGTVGVAHAALAKRLKEDKIATSGALLGVAAAVAASQPELVQYGPLLTQAATVVTAASAGSFLLSRNED